MKKLLCDICNGALEMNADGKGAVCTCCGMTYSTARLKEKLGIGEPVQQTAYDAPVSEIAYDVAVSESVGEIKEFCFRVEDRFMIKDRGVVVTGYVQDAPIHVGDPVTLIRKDGVHLQTSVLGLEHYKELYDSLEPVKEAGILLSAIDLEDVSAGDVLTTPTAAARRPFTTDYFVTVHCSNCGIPLHLYAQYKGVYPNCPHCNTPIQPPKKA